MFSKYLLNWFENQLDWDFYKLIHNYIIIVKAFFFPGLSFSFKKWEILSVLWVFRRKKSGKIQPLNKMILFSRMAPKLPLWKVKPLRGDH